MRSPHYKIAGVVVLSPAMLAFAHAESSGDQFPQPADILSRLISAAQTYGEPLSSSVLEGSTYQLRRAEYIGGCQSTFGCIYAGAFFYLRSARQGSNLPARGHSFIVFFDAGFRARAFWSLDEPLPGLAFDGTKLLLGDRLLCDFANLPEERTIIIDGQLQIIPTWPPPTK